jgi:RHS repeat-associated protein
MMPVPPLGVFKGGVVYYPFGLTFNSYQRENSVKNQHLYNNGAERQDELDLNVDATKFRMYDPAMGRWWQPDPLADDGTLISLTPYNYSGNDPIRYNDPDGDCPWCWGAVIGAAVDYGLQITTNLAQGKDLGDALTDVDVGSILVSAGAGAVSGGISSISKLKNASNLVKLAVDVTVDASASAAGQVVRDGEVSLEKTVVDVVGSQTIGKSLGNTAKNNAVNSTKGKALQAEVNTQKNIARGKSNTTPKSKADVKGAEKKLDNYANKKALATSAASSGVASTIYESIDEKQKKN